MELLPFFIFFVLYAEIHFKITGLPNFLFKKEPEIIADLPYRLEKGKVLPVLVLIKDAHLYPVSLQKVIIKCRQNCLAVTRESNFQCLSIDSIFWWRIIAMELPESLKGDVEVDVQIEIRIGGRTKMIHSDNYRRIDHKPFHVFIDEDPLPGKSGWYFGDLHFHSQYTNDQVEFGAPIPAAVAMAHSMGLHFFAVTDHSYDLDDRTGDYLHYDPDLPLWKEMQSTIRELNKNTDSVVVIPGEEISVGNALNRNVHMLLLNPIDFFRGYGDSAEEWFKVRPQNGIPDVLHKSRGNFLAFAAHPEKDIPFFDRLFLGRGKWQPQDYGHHDLHGLQILNGKTDPSFEKGRLTWIKLLLEGKKISVIAGSDAHGNFGRFRGIKIPFLQLINKHQPLFGQARTAVFMNEKLSLASLIAALKKGCSAVTDGPFAELQIKTCQEEVLHPGDISACPQGDLSMEALSSPAFGSLQYCDLYIGDVEHQHETRQRIDLRALKTYQWRTTMTDMDFPKTGYVRLEAYSEKEGSLCRCLTNPIYFLLKTSESTHPTGPG